MPLLHRDSVSLRVVCHSEPAAVLQGRWGGELTRKRERGRARELGEQQEHLKGERKPLLMACDSTVDVDGSW